MQNSSLKRSLGSLRKAQKTKERSPDSQGTIKVQRHTLDVLMKQMRESDSDEVTANLAGWLHEDHSGRYISVELSPRYVSKKPVCTDAIINTFDAFFQDKEIIH